MNEAAEADKGAVTLINQWIEKGLVQQDANGQPNIIGNAQDQAEEQMFVNQRLKFELNDSS